MRACGLCGLDGETGTDRALLTFATKYEATLDDDDDYVVLDEAELASEQRWMARVVHTSAHDGGLFRSRHTAAAAGHVAEVMDVEPDDDQNHDNDVILIKGAASALMRKLSSVLELDGRERALEPRDLKRVQRLEDEMCLLGQRVLLVAKRVCNYKQLMAVRHMRRLNTSLAAFVDQECNGFCLLGLVGLVDPLR